MLLRFSVIFPSTNFYKQTDDSMLAHSILTHEYTADQMISFQITFNQKSTKSKLVYTRWFCLHLTANVFEGVPLKSQK